ncbi:P-loop NTPase fold protein [Pseudomonas sp. On1]|uniref:YobI family P-loop NTPase n=1 Tax=Pseudomonas sp. On1 TaxID=3083258 RepID=UPI0029A3FC87|nr:P-loop NTPase fold protein [Pseudomonas sp. On1]MDX2310468.1 hypothetical protein [Pseudomonas sp. On1]
MKRVWEALAVGISESFKAYDKSQPPPSDEKFFEPLTPVRLKEEISGRYERELRHALENPEILNIAVTGSYGAGKSSVLKTFFENHRFYKHTFVSLATFTKPGLIGASEAEPKPDASSQTSAEKGAHAAEPKGDKDNKVEKADKDVLINRIEETIVQQLLYAVRASKVPKTRLKRITQTSSFHLWLRTGAMTAIAVCALRLYSPTIANKAGIASSWLLEKLLLIPESGALVGLALGSVWLLYTALKFLSLFSIDGLTLKGGKLEATQHGSVLHKNVDEIIYCFERSDVNVVVIEDLDRFDIQEIFFRLREINLIIRSSPQIKRSVHFVYAIRDEMFGVGDKTKFFDLIIPIIPVVHGDNAREQLSKLLDERTLGDGRLSDRLDERLIDHIGYYIDEMRLIKNIVNEYDIYQSLLAPAGVHLNPNKLFAMVAIRNLYPGAFADLVKRRGRLYSIFEEYPKWVVAQLGPKTGELTELTARWATRQQDHASDLVELRLRVWYEVIQRGGSASANALVLDGSSYLTLPDFVEDSGFERFKAANHATPALQQRSGHEGTTQYPKSILEELNYEARSAVLSDSLVMLDAEVAGLEREIHRLKAVPFRVAVKDAYGEVVREKLADYKMIFFLVLKGYLDTDYADYFGYFYEGTLTQSDKNLILALGREELVEVDTPVQKPDRVVRALDHESLSEGRGILVNLIAELLQHGFKERDEREEREAKLAVILKGGLQALERLGQALEILIEAGKGRYLMRALYMADSELVLHVLGDERFKPDAPRARWLYHVLENLDADEVAKLDHNGQLSKLLNERENVTSWVSRLEANQHGWQWLRSKPAQFAKIHEGIGADDLKALVRMRCLKLNLRMLSLLCKVMDGNNKDQSVSYDRLSILDVPDLVEQLREDIPSLVGELLQQEGVLNESSGSLRALLEMLTDQPDLMRWLFDRTHASLPGLEENLREVWLLAMAADRIKSQGVSRAVWRVFGDVMDRRDRVAEFVQADDAEKILLEFIVRNAHELAPELWEQSDQQTALQRFLLRDERVPAETLKTLFARTRVDVSILDDSLPALRWKYLSTAECLPYSEVGRQAFWANAPDLELTYLLSHWEEVRQIQDFAHIPIALISDLSKSETPSLEDLINMWLVVPAQYLSDKPEAAAALASVCARANKQGLTFPIGYLPVILRVVAEASLSNQHRSDLIIQALALGCDWSQIADQLPLLGQEFAGLAGERRTLRLPVSDSRIKVLKALERRLFIRCISSETHIFAARIQSTH